MTLNDLWARFKVIDSLNATKMAKYSLVMTRHRVESLPLINRKKRTVWIVLYSGFAWFALLLQATCTMCKWQVVNYSFNELCFNWCDLCAVVTHMSCITWHECMQMILIFVFLPQRKYYNLIQSWCHGLWNCHLSCLCDYLFYTLFLVLYRGVFMGPCTYLPWKSKNLLYSYANIECQKSYGIIWTLLKCASEMYTQAPFWHF